MRKSDKDIHILQLQAKVAKLESCFTSGGTSLSAYKLNQKIKELNGTVERLSRENRELIDKVSSYTTINGLKANIYRLANNAMMGGY